MSWKPAPLWLLHLVVWSPMCSVQAGWCCPGNKDFGAKKTHVGQEGGQEKGVLAKAVTSEAMRRKGGSKPLAVDKMVSCGLSCDFLSAG